MIENFANSEVKSIDRYLPLKKPAPQFPPPILGLTPRSAPIHPPKCGISQVDQIGAFGSMDRI
jgi:hypothetical protein